MGYIERSFNNSSNSFIVEERIEKRHLIFDRIQDYNVYGNLFVRIMDLCVCLYAGTINLEECVGVVPHTDPVKNYKHVFDVRTKERVYHLSAETSEEKWAWISTLQGLLFPPKVRGRVGCNSGVSLVGVV